MNNYQELANFKKPQQTQTKQQNKLLSIVHNIWYSLLEGVLAKKLQCYSVKISATMYLNEGSQFKK